MRGEAAFQPVEPLPETEDVEILGRDVGGPRLRDLANLGALVRRGQPQAGVETLLDRGIASGTAEDEVDRRQQAGAVEAFDDVRSRRRRPASRPAPAPEVLRLQP